MLEEKDISAQYDPKTKRVLRLKNLELKIKKLLQSSLATASSSRDGEAGRRVGGHEAGRVSLRSGVAALLIV